MRNRTATLIFALALVLTGCSGGGTTGELPTLDLEAAIDNPRPFDLGDIAEKIDFIPLDDSNKEGLIGMMRLLEESKNGWYVYDGTDRPVKIFDRTGRLVATRGILGRGPDEMRAILRIAVDWENDNLYMIGYGNNPDVKGKMILAYDAAGNILTRSNTTGIASYAEYYDGNLIVLNEEDMALRFSPTPVSYDWFNIIETFSPDLQRGPGMDVPYKGPNFRKLSSNSIQFGAASVLSTNGHSLLTKEGRSDTVFHYKNGALKPAYVLDLGHYTIPAAALGMEPTAELGKTGYVYNMFEGDRYLFFEVRGHEGFGQIPLIVDRREPDSGFSASGADKGRLLSGGIIFTPMYVRDNRLVGYMQAIDIVDNTENITDPQLKALAATLKEDSNPVIVVATLKK